MLPRRDSTCQRIRSRFRFSLLRLGDLALQLRDPRVALPERRLAVRARLGGAAGSASRTRTVAGNTSGTGAVTGVAAARARHLRRLRVLRLVALRLLHRALAGLVPRVLQAIHVPSFP